MTVKSLVALTLLLLTLTCSFGQKINKQQRDSIKVVMDQIGVDDQKYRWQLMLGELDSVKLDSLKNLPDNLRFDRIRKAMSGQVGFNQAVRDSIIMLQTNLDSSNDSIFLTIIYKYGYPSFKRVGSETAGYLTLHMASEKDFINLSPIFLQELNKGNMPAEDYAAWFDRCQLSMEKKQLYGQYNQDSPCVENLDKTNEERKKIGLKKINANNCD